RYPGPFQRPSWTAVHAKGDGRRGGRKRGRDGHLGLCYTGNKTKEETKMKQKAQSYLPLVLSSKWAIINVKLPSAVPYRIIPIRTRSWLFARKEKRKSSCHIAQGETNPRYSFNSILFSSIQSI